MNFEHAPDLSMSPYYLTDFINGCFISKDSAKLFTQLKHQPIKDAANSGVSYIGEVVADINDQFYYLNTIKDTIVALVEQHPAKFGGNFAPDYSRIEYALSRSRIEITINSSIGGDARTLIIVEDRIDVRSFFKKLLNK